MNRREAILKAAALLCAGGTAFATPRAHGAAQSLGLFDAERDSCLARITELIVPATDTPGASAAGVPAFIAAVIRDIYTAEERAAFEQGLSVLHARACSRASGKQPFDDELSQVLHELDEDREPAAAGSASACYRAVRDLTLVGYYTSQLGAEAELRYLAVPGYYRSDVDVTEIGRAWL